VKIIPVRTVSGVAILRVALIAVAATSAVCWIGIMLEYEVHPWLLVLTAGSVTGVVAGILQHRALAIAYVVGTVVALLDVFVASISDGTLRFTLLGASTLAGFPIGLAAIKLFGRSDPVHSKPGSPGPC
jgi:hypothetical protein